MRDGIFLAAIFVFAAFIGLLAVELGISQPVVTPPGVPDQPGSGGFFDSLLAPLIYTFNSVAAFFQIITFQIPEIPTILSVLLLPFFSITTIWLIVRIIRGGG